MGAHGLDLLQVSSSSLRVVGFLLCWGLAVSMGLYRRKRSRARATAVAAFFWATAVFWLLLVAQFALARDWELALLTLAAGAWVTWLIHDEVAGL